MDQMTLTQLVVALQRRRTGYAIIYASKKNKAFLTSESTTPQPHLNVTTPKSRKRFHHCCCVGI